MCGIVGYIGHREAAPLILESLRKLEYRGYDSAGIAVLHDGQVAIRRCEGKLGNLETMLQRQPIAGAVGIGHTRWATHGRPSETNAHPHRAGDVVVVHNGIIENYLELKDQLSARGVQFSSETDSEIVAHLVAEKIERGIDFLDATPPAVPSPQAAVSFDHTTPFGRVRPPFFFNFDTRLALGQEWWQSDWQPGPARLARWFRYRVPQQREDGSFDPLAIPPIADTMPPALIQKLGPEHEPFFAPSLDLTVHFLEDTSSEWLLTNVYARRARAGYATAEVEIWDDEGRLVSMATQMMMLRRSPKD